MARSAAEIEAQLQKLSPWWLRDPDEVADAVLEAFAFMFERVEGGIGTLHDRTFVDRADGGWLDEHGRERGIPRDTSESDHDYAPRVRGIEDKVTRAAILAGINKLLTTGAARMEEFRRDVMFAAPAGQFNDPRSFAGTASAYDRKLGYQLFIPDQAVDPQNTAFAAPTGQFNDSRSFAWADPVAGPYPQPGMYAEPETRNPSDIYRRVAVENDRLRAAGFLTRIVVE